MCVGQVLVAAPCTCCAGPQLQPAPCLQCISRASFVALPGQFNCRLALISHPLSVLKMTAEGSREDSIVLSKLSIRVCFLRKSL